jgi:uncharacterized protein YjbI with pentapeptide repeats
LNSKGAHIEVLSPSALYQRIIPTQADVDLLIRAGEPGYQRFSQRLELAGITADQQPSKLLPHYCVVNWDALEKDLTCTPLWCLSLESCDFRKSKIDKHTHGLQRIGSLQDCQFEQAKWCCHFTGVSGCIFTRADLSGSTFQENTRFEGTFKFAKLVSCDFSRADLSDCDFSGAVLRESNFEKALVQTAKFDSAKLQSIEARDADFTNSSFVNADLQGADLTGAILIDCDFTGANLKNAVLFGATLKGAQLHGADLTGADLALAKLEGVDCTQAIGLTHASQADLTSIAELLELEAITKRSERYVTSVKGSYRGTQITLRLQYEEFGRYPQQYCVSWSADVAGTDFPSWEETSPNCSEAIALLVNSLPGASILPHTAQVELTLLDQSQALSTADKFQEQQVASATAVWCAAFGTEIPDSEAMELLRQSDQARLFAEFEQAAVLLWEGNVSGWNAFDRSPIDLHDKTFTADFQGLVLDQVDLNGLNFAQSQFCNVSMKQAQLKDTVFEQCSFDGADLEYANFSNSNLETATFVKANLRGARFDHARMPLAHATALQNAAFNSSTSFPSGFAIPSSMDWQGWGPDPRTKVVTMNLRATVTALIHLRRIVENNRIDKALAMLQSEKFALYSDATDQCITGVVRSQSVGALVYACRLTASGEFACCTQNLNACGGLRGSLCKHLLVLLIGLVQQGGIETEPLSKWLAACRNKKPKLDKDAMSEVFLRYKGAQSGELQWRPMETIPEDFYAL